ncbi:MAG: stage IV sporulation protein A [Lachnospiraceae bacterium]|nr:stage IV sporulation protein A [Lachnospiraceae bacterium]
MDYNQDSTYNLYRDIQLRTKGEIYLGVVGPVRTGKSTFIKRFMELLVLPAMEDQEEKNRSMDELPQSAAGRTITTTEPKFIPKEAARLTLQGDISVKVRLIDCVGYMVEGAAGHLENEKERLVKTPWSKEEIPFTKAAEIGTKKVITQHSTLGVVVTTDGSIGDLERAAYIPSEEKTISQLQKLQKPFVVILNTTKPYGDDTRQLAESMREKYKVSVIPINCMQMKKEDILQILQEALEEFPIVHMDFFMPRWMEGIEEEHPVKKAVIEWIREFSQSIDKMKDLKEKKLMAENNYITRSVITGVFPSQGRIEILLETDEKYYYEMLSQITGQDIYSQYELVTLLKDYSNKEKEYTRVSQAMEEVRQQGYSVVLPLKEDVEMEEPSLMKHGNKYGVKIRSQSPSIHMIKADIISEIAPIVGTEKQAMDLIDYIKEKKEAPGGIWSANIFGKTVEQLIQEGIHGKISGMGRESRENLRNTMQKILNESNGGMIFIII